MSDTGGGHDPGTQDPVQARLTELEVRISYQNQLLSDLDAVLREFAGRVESLERELEQLREAMSADPGETGPHNDPPPHY